MIFLSDFVLAVIYREHVMISAKSKFITDAAAL